MYEGRKVAAVIAAHNEERHIAGVITSLPDVVDIVVVVDDASPDGTSEAARATGDPRLVLVRHETNTGVGGAVCSAYRAALDAGADLFVRLDGDGQMDPTYLVDLLEPLVQRDYGFAKANRFFSPSSFQGMPRHRIVGNVVLSFLTKASSGYWHLFDPQNGYTAVTREVLERLDLDRIRKGYDFENDFLINLNILGIRACDVPVPAIYGDEVSGIRLPRVVPLLIATLFRGFWKRITLKYLLYDVSPIALLLFTGLGLLVFAAYWGIFALSQSLSGQPPTAGTVLLAVTPFVVATQMLLSALQLDIAESPR